VPHVTVFAGNAPLTVEAGDGASFSNATGGATVYYGSDEEVTTASSSIAAGVSTVLTGTVYLFVPRSTTGARADVDVNPVPTVDQPTAVNNAAAMQRKLEAAHRDCLFPGAVLSLRFDDIPVYDFTTIKPLLDARNFLGSFAVPKSYIGTTSNSAYAPATQNAMTLTQVKQLQDEGHEITNHSRTHLDPNTNGGQAYFADNTATVQAELLAQNLRAECFTQPGSWTGSYNFNSQSFLDYSSADIGLPLRATHGCVEGYVTEGTTGAQVHGFPCVNRFGWSHFTASDDTLANSKLYVDRVVQRCAFGQILCHAYQLDQASHMTLVDFTALLDYIKTYVDAGLLSIASGPTACSFAGKGTPTNILTDPTFTNCTTGGSYGDWIPTGAPTITAAVGKSGGKALVQTNDPANNIAKEIFCTGPANGARVDVDAQRCGCGQRYDPAYRPSARPVRHPARQPGRHVVGRSDLHPP
jgi:hypothetical protein